MESLIAFGWVRTRFGEVGGQLDGRRARGVLNPCARESKVRTGRFLKRKLMSDRGPFSSYEDQQRAVNGQDSWGVFQGYVQDFGRPDAGSRAGFTSSRPPPHGPPHFNFPYFCMMTCGLEKLGLVGQNSLERNLPALLLRKGLWSLRIFPPLPGSRLTDFYRDASSALLQLVIHQ